MSAPLPLLTDRTTTGQGSPVSLRSQRSRDEVLVQVDIVGGTATVDIYGRLASRLGWILLTSVSSSQIVPIARVAELRVDVSAIAGATVNAEAYLDF